MTIDNILPRGTYLILGISTGAWLSSEITPAFLSLLCLVALPVWLVICLVWEVAHDR